MPSDHNHRSLLRRALASGLAAVYLFTNAAAAHAAESAFWGERRRAARARFQPATDDSRPLYAQLPKNISSTPDLSAVLGQVSPQTAVNLADLGKAVAQTTDRRILDAAQAILPYGNVRFVRESKKPGAPLILHIQDVHGNLEAQKNMAEMMLALARDHGVQLAGLEGATGAFATDEFKPYPDQEAVKKVAAYFMKKDILGGPEYAALASEKPITLWGIEDPALYQANVKAVKSSLAARPHAETFLASLNGALDSLKKVHYTEDLQAFDKNQSLYDQGHEGLGDFVQTLTKFDGRSDAVLSLKFPNVSRLLSALREEKTLNFSVVERDRSALVEKLVAKLAQADLQDLVRRSVDLRGGKTSHNAYHAYLRALCARNGLSLSAYPSLTAYMHYVAASEEIDREDLLKEMAALENSVQDALAKTADQKKLVDLSRDASRLKKLLNNEMTPDDWAAYKTRQTEITNLPSRLQSLDQNATVRWPDNLATFLSPFESFCARAMDRNAALSGRLLEKMAQDKHPIAILVAGGFHTEGLMDTLANQGASVAVLTPKIGQVDPTHRYLDAFAQDPLPLEKIFNGEPISIKTECAIAENSISGIKTREYLHQLILAFTLELFRIRRMAMGDSLAEIKSKLVTLMEEIKEKVKEVGRFEVSLKAVKPNGIKVDIKGSRSNEFESRDGSIYFSNEKPPPIASILEDPTFKEEWKIAWREKFDFLSPIHFFAWHTQWKGMQNVIGALLILGLWVIMGETAGYVLDLLSKIELPFFGNESLLNFAAAILAGWSATLPSHVAWNLFATKANRILAQNGFTFRLPRLTIRVNGGQGGENKRTLHEFSLNQSIPLAGAFIQLTGIRDENYWRKEISDIVHHQFSSPLRGIVEAITNGLDAGADIVTVSYKQNQLTIHDNGTGMGKDDILTKLLVPKISGQSENEDNRGQFGVGFYALLGFIKENGDSLSVTTQKDGKTHELLYQMTNGEILVLLRELTPNEFQRPGTSVQINAADLPQELEVYGELVKDLSYLEGPTMKFISADGKETIINEIPENFVRVKTKGASIKSWDMGGVGKMVVTVKGLTVLVINSPQSAAVVLEINDKTAVPRARNDLNLSTQVHSILVNLIDRVVSSGNVKLINGLAGIIIALQTAKGGDLERILIKRWREAVSGGQINGPFLPDDEALSAAEGVHIHPVLFSALEGELTGLNFFKREGITIYLVKGKVLLKGEESFMVSPDIQMPIAFMAESRAPENDFQRALVDAYFAMESLRNPYRMGNLTAFLSKLLGENFQKDLAGFKLKISADLIHFDGFAWISYYLKLRLILFRAWWKMSDFLAARWQSWVLGGLKFVRVLAISVRKMFQRNFIEHRVRINLSQLPQLMGSDFSDANLDEIIQIIRRTKSEELTQIGVEHMKGALRTSVDHQNSDPLAFVRENIQNAGDAAIKERESDTGFRAELKISLRPPTESMDGPWGIVFEDNVGMSPNNVVRHLLIPGVSSKDGDDSATGQFGQGFFTNLRGSDSVVFKTGREGEVTTAIFTPVRDANGRIQDVTIDVEVVRGAYRGTRIEINRTGDFLKGRRGVEESLKNNARWIDPERIAIYYLSINSTLVEGQNQFNDAASQEKARLAKMETPFGALTVFKSPRHYSRLHYRRQDMKALQYGNNFFDKSNVPHMLQVALTHAGVIVDLPGGLDVIADRSDIVDPEKRYEELAVPIFGVSLMAVANLLARGEVDDQLLPYDWRTNPHLEVDAAILEDGARLAKNELPLDELEKYHDEWRLRQLLFVMPLWNGLSIQQVAMLAQNRSQEYLISLGIPEEVVLMIYHARKVDEIIEENMGKDLEDLDEEGKVLRSDYSLATDPDLYAFHAFQIWTREIARRAVNFESPAFSEKLMPSVSFSVKKINAVAYVLGGIPQVWWNLADKETESHLSDFARLLRGELLLDSSEAHHLLGWVLEVITHESVHVLEGSEEGNFTHDVNFFRRQEKMFFKLSTPEVSQELLGLLNALARKNIPPPSVNRFLRSVGLAGQRGKRIQQGQNSAGIYGSAPGALGVWDRFSFSRGWTLAQRGWAEGRWTGVLYLLWMAGAMAFGFIPMAPPGLDPAALLAISLASFFTPSLVFGIAIAVFSIALHRITGVKLDISEPPEKEWSTVLIASFKSLSGLAGIPMIAVGVALASLGGAFGLPWMILGVVAGALIAYHGVELGAGAHQKVNARVEGMEAVPAVLDMEKVPVNGSENVKKQLEEKLNRIFLSGPARPVWFDFNDLQREYRVRSVVPENASEFRGFLRNSYNALPSIEDSTFANLASLLTPEPIHMGEAVDLARQDKNFRMALARWAMAELVLVTHGNVRSFLGAAKSAISFENRVIGTETSRTSEARLVRAAKALALLRAAGSSLSDPIGLKDDPAEHERDIEILLSAWGMTDLLMETIKESRVNPRFVDEYNKVLQIMAQRDVWTHVAEERAIPPVQSLSPVPSGPHTGKVVYFNVDSLVNRNENSLKVAEALKALLRASSSGPVGRVSVVLVTTQNDISSKIAEWSSQFGPEMLNAAQLPLLHKGSFNIGQFVTSATLQTPGQPDLNIGNIHLNTLAKDAKARNATDFELWTDFPDRVVEKENNENRIVNVLRLSQAIQSVIETLRFLAISA